MRGVVAVIRLGLFRSIRSRLVWVPLAGCLVVGMAWVNIVRVDAANAHVTPNAWDLLLMLQNNGFVLTFGLLVPYSLWIGGLVDADREAGYRSQLSIRLQQKAVWAYPLGVLGIFMAACAFETLGLSLVWLAMGWATIGHLATSWSSFARAHSVYWDLSSTVLHRSPLVLAFFGFIWNTVSVLAVGWLATAFGQWARVRYAGPGMAVLLGALSLWLSHGVAGLRWSILAQGILLLHRSEHTPGVSNLPAGWPAVYILILIIFSTVIFWIQHAREGSW